MADFDIRDIAALKVKLQIIEKLVLADWILIILSSITTGEDGSPA